MDSRSRAVKFLRYAVPIAAAFIVALVTPLGTEAGKIVVAFFNRSAGTSPTIGAATCDPIPAVEERSPPPKEGQVWVPTDFKLSSGKLEAVLGHWERKRADGKTTYIPGHWDIGTGRCVWVRGKFV